MSDRVQIDVNNMTVAQIRSTIRNLTKLANEVIYSSDSETTVKNREYFMRDFHDTRVGGITSNIRVNYVTKAQGKRLISELTSFINADVDSQSYTDYLNKTRAKSIRKMKKTIRERYGRNVSDADIDELFAIEEMFPELFDSDETFYKTVLSISSIMGHIRRNAKGQFPSLMQLIKDCKKSLETSGTAWTKSDLKRAVLNSINVSDAEYEKQRLKVKI